TSTTMSYSLMRSSSWMSIRVRGRARRGRFLICAHHGGIDPVDEPEAQGLDRPVDRVLEGPPLALREGFENVVAQIALPSHVMRPPHAHAQPRARPLPALARDPAPARLAPPP